MSKRSGSSFHHYFGIRASGPTFRGLNTSAYGGETSHDATGTGEWSPKRAEKTDPATCVELVRKRGKMWF